jgi:hypothetical protein
VFENICDPTPQYFLSSDWTTNVSLGSSGIRHATCACGAPNKNYEIHVQVPSSFVEETSPLLTAWGALAGSAFPAGYDAGNHTGFLVDWAAKPSCDPPSPAPTPLPPGDTFAPTPVPTKAPPPPPVCELPDPPALTCEDCDGSFGTVGSDKWCGCCALDCGGFQVDCIADNDFCEGRCLADHSWCCGIGSHTSTTPGSPGTTEDPQGTMAPSVGDKDSDDKDSASSQLVIFIAIGGVALFCCSLAGGGFLHRHRKRRRARNPRYLSDTDFNTASSNTLTVDTPTLDSETSTRSNENAFASPPPPLTVTGAAGDADARRRGGARTPNPGSRIGAGGLPPPPPPMGSGGGMEKSSSSKKRRNRNGTINNNGAVSLPPPPAGRPPPQHSPHHSKVGQPPPPRQPPPPGVPPPSAGRAGGGGGGGGWKCLDCGTRNLEAANNCKACRSAR